MKEEKKFLWFTGIVAGLVILLVIPVTVSENGLFLFSKQIPFNVTEGIKDAVFGNFFRLSILLSTAVSIMLFASSLKRKLMMSVFFALVFFYTLYFILAVKLGFSATFFKLNFFYAAYICHLLAFLILFKRLFNSALISSLIIMILQMGGGILVYFYDFRDFLGEGFQNGLTAVYALLPVYQKMDGIYQNNSFWIMIVGIACAVIIFGFEVFLNRKTTLVKGE